MSAIKGAISQPLRGVVVITWGALTSTNTSGVAERCPHFSDKSIQVTGTFDSGTLILEGSNDGTNYITLHDPQGNALSFTAADLEQVLENVDYIRPSLSGAGGSASINVILLSTTTARR